MHGGWQVLGAMAVLMGGAAAASAPEPWTGLDTERYSLVTGEGGYSLERPGGKALPIPKEWLVPAAEVEADEQSYVTSFHYGPEVTVFALGDGRVGLHLSPYEFQRKRTRFMSCSETHP